MSTALKLNESCHVAILIDSHFVIFPCTITNRQFPHSEILFGLAKYQASLDDTPQIMSSLSDFTAASINALILPNYVAEKVKALVSDLQGTISTSNYDEKILISKVLFAACVHF